MAFIDSVLGWMPQRLYSHTPSNNHLLTDLLTPATQSDLNVKNNSATEWSPPQHRQHAQKSKLPSKKLKCGLKF